MAQNFIQHGNSMTLTPSVAVAAGDGYLFGSGLFGIALHDVAANKAGAFGMVGVWQIAKAAGEAIADGAPVCWNATTKRVSAIGAGPRIGVAQAALAAATFVHVRLDHMPNAVSYKTNPVTGGVEVPVLSASAVPSLDNTLALLGDSITLRNQQGATAVWNNEGYFIVANMLMGQKYDIINVTGLSGYTIEQIADYVDDIIASGAKNCFVLAGTNNATDADAATIFNKLTSLLWQPLRAAGVRVSVGTIPPNGGWTATQSAKMADVNDMIRAAPASYPGLRVADLWAATVDASTGGPKAGVFGDSIHPVARGGMYFARPIAEVLGDVDTITTSRATGGRLDPYILSANPLAIGNNAGGTNGTLIGVGATGTGPDQWSILTSNAATTVVCSGNNARNPVDYIDGKACDLAVTYGGDDHYLQVGLLNGADIYLDRAWAATTAKIAGTLVKPTAGRAGGFQYKALTSGTTGGSEPTWPVILGATITDGTVTWMAVKDVVAGDIYQFEAEVVFSALSGYVCPALRIPFDTSAYAGTLRPLLIANGVAVASADTNPVSPLYNTGTAAWDYVPLNIPIVVRSQKIVIPAQAEVSHISPQFRLYGKNGTTASLKVQRLEFRRIF